VTLWARVLAAGGIVSLAQRKYSLAASDFLRVSTKITEDPWPEVISVKDIATYGALCALAEYPRSVILEQIINNNVFQQHLDNVPHIRDLVNHFYNSRFSKCLNMLEAMKATLRLDVWFKPHIASVFKSIKQKALQEYVSPYLSVDLRKMAPAFNTTVDQVELDVAELIQSDRVQARIDKANHIVYARQSNLRVSTFEHALRFGRRFIRSTEGAMRQLNMNRYNFVAEGGKGGEVGLGREFGRGGFFGGAMGYGGEV